MGVDTRRAFIHVGSCSIKMEIERKNGIDTRRFVLDTKGKGKEDRR